MMGSHLFRTVLVGISLLLLGAGNGARAQTASSPVLTIDDAFATAVSHTVEGTPSMQYFIALRLPR